MSFFNSNADAEKTAALKVPILPHTSPEAPQPTSIKTPLYPHQLRALHRCLLIENDGSLAKDFGAKYDFRSRGGCLADAVGMGKTATSIGLILSSPRTNSEEGDTLVVAPSHLIHQWKAEIEKFTDDIEVLVGRKEYERRATLPPEGKSHRVVLMDVETVMNEDKLWYNWRRVYSDENGYERRVDLATMEKYKKAALFCVKSPRGPCSYEGYVYTGPLHHPFRPWRRVIFDEIQDLVSEGTESQKNLLQLSRTAKNVWLLSATPFPHGNMSVYANHELLGFCRLRLDVEVDYELSRSHPFEIIKRKLYIRSPKHVADVAVTASQKVTQTTTQVDATALERKFFELEQDDIVSRNKFAEDYASLRQMMVHPEASKKLREQINGRDEDYRGGRTAQKVASNNRTVGRFATVNSFARRSLDTARTRFRDLNQTELPRAAKEIEEIKSSWYLALKIKDVRRSAVQANPFARRDDASSTPPTCMETMEANAIHEYYCRCPRYGSNDCQADAKCAFQTMGRGRTLPVWERGYGSVQRVIDYFKNEVKQGRQIPLQEGSTEEREYLEVYISRKERTYKGCVTRMRAQEEEKTDVERRITALEETVKTAMEERKLTRSEEDELVARNGSKCAALITYLQEVEEKNEQTIVFSYWHDTLSLVHKSLRKYVSVSFCNQKTGNAMSKTIMEFTSGKTSVLLLSGESKASGANLQCATRVVLLDPAGKSAEHGATLEQQAIGRAVRMGQENAVKVVRFCVADTIEEDLFEAIDLAAAKLITRSNDSTYMCEDSHKSLDKKVLDKKKSAVDDEVLVGESLSAREVLKRKTAIAKANNDIIVIDDSDDEDDNLNPVSAAVPMKTLEASSLPVKVKGEPKASLATAKRTNAEVTETNEAATNPDKRAKVSETATASSASTHTDAIMQDVSQAVSNEIDVVPNAQRQEASAPRKDIYLADAAGKVHDPETEQQKRASAEKRYKEVCQVDGMSGHHAKWLGMYMELKKVKDATGHAWVAGQKGRLGKWCKLQRRLFGKFNKGDHSDVTVVRMMLLKEIDFLWFHGQAEPTPKKQVAAASDGSRVISPTGDIAAENGVPSSSTAPSNVSNVKTHTPGAKEAPPSEGQNGTVLPPTSGHSPATEKSVSDFISGRVNLGGLRKSISESNSSSSSPTQTEEEAEERQTPPGKVQTETTDDEEGRVVSPPADQMEVAPDNAIEEGYDSDATAPVPETAGSPAADEMDTTLEALVDSGLQEILKKCELGQYITQFQGAGIESATQLLANLQDLSFMQDLVNRIGLTAMEAVRLQIVASKQ